jgi:hypothetical protein
MARKSRLARAKKVRGSMRLKKLSGWSGYSSFLDKSRSQLASYKKSGDVESLAQSGEKLWNAFNLLVQKKVGYPVRNYSAFQKAVSELYQRTGSDLLLRSASKAYNLHVFFYRGYTENVAVVENDNCEVYEGMKILEKSLAGVAS